MKNRATTIMLTVIMCLVMATAAFAQSGRVLISHLSDEGGEYKAAYRYYNEDYSMAKNEWKQIVGDWYYFGDDGISKQSMWFEVDGKWYYFDEKSVMLHDTTTPDGYTVGADGAWVTE